MHINIGAEREGHRFHPHPYPLHYHHHHHHKDTDLVKQIYREGRGGRDGETKEYIPIGVH